MEMGSRETKTCDNITTFNFIINQSGREQSLPWVRNETENMMNGFVLFWLIVLVENKLFSNSHHQKHQGKPANIQVSLYLELLEERV